MNGVKVTHSDVKSEPIPTDRSAREWCLDAVLRVAIEKQHAFVENDKDPYPHVRQPLLLDKARKSGFVFSAGENPYFRADFDS